MNRGWKDDDLEKDNDLDVCWAKPRGIVVLINARARFQFTLFRAVSIPGGGDKYDASS